MSRTPIRNRPGDRSGLSIIYVIILLVVLIAFVGFAVDVGRIRLVRSQLQTAAEAAARGTRTGSWPRGPGSIARRWQGQRSCSSRFGSGSHTTSLPS